jgi:hypothetical protein
MTGRILYLCPDLDHPSGGVAAIYEHVRILARHGFPTFVLHFERNAPDRYAGPPPPLLCLASGLRLSREDLLVVPEGCLFEGLSDLRGLRKIAFVQSALYAFDGPGGWGLWEEVDFAGAICCSELTASFARSTLSIPDARVVQNSVDPALFAPGDKTLAIAAMPRKQPVELRFLEQAFRLRNPGWRGIPWLQLERMTRAEVGRALSGAAVFLSTCLYEGFGLPALEAMACGCLVTGFHGYGGLEYANAANGLWCDQGDLMGALAALERAVALHQANGPEAADLRREALATAASYSPARQEAALLEAWSGWMV